MEALEILDSGAKVDAIVLDINMPRMDGIAFLKVLNERHQREKVLIVSTLAQKGGAETIRALELGAFDFITKPTSLFRSEGSFLYRCDHKDALCGNGIIYGRIGYRRGAVGSETGNTENCV